MLADAGFADVEVHDVPDDPLDSLYVTRRPEAKLYTFPGRPRCW